MLEYIILIKVWHEFIKGHQNLFENKEVENERTNMYLKLQNYEMLSV